jgi:3-oxoadipate CoA-transferase alpha subunit
MVDKKVASMEEAIRDIKDGATILVGGFGPSGQPVELLEALVDSGVRDLTVVNNNSGNEDYGLARLIKLRRVRKLIASFAKTSDSYAFDEVYAAGEIEYECVPQGTLAERLRAAGAGLGGFWTPTAYGTPLAEGKETRIIDGVGYVMEFPLKGDFALVKAHRADSLGNLVYRKAARNFGPVMCMAARTTIAQVTDVVEPGGLDPEVIVTPGIFVQRVVCVPARTDSLEGARE